MKRAIVQARRTLFQTRLIDFSVGSELEYVYV